MKPPHFYYKIINKNSIAYVSFKLASEKATKKTAIQNYTADVPPKMIYGIGFSTEPLTRQIERNACSSLTRPHGLHSEKSV
jgi:hypothetical protein